MTIEHATLSERRAIAFAPPTKAELTEARRRGLTKVNREQITELRRDQAFRTATRTRKQVAPAKAVK